MTDEQYLKEWFAKASDDLKIIRQAMDRPDSDWVTEPNFPTYELGDLTTFAVQVRYPGEAYVPSGDETVEYVRLANMIVSDLRQLVFTGLSARSSKPPDSKARDDR